MRSVISISAALLLLILFAFYGSRFDRSVEIVPADPATLEPLVKTKVDWHSWFPAAFQEAADKDIPVFLYLSTFWSADCHQMDTASFSDSDLAGRLNNQFVPVKVNCESRPDICERYFLGSYPSCVVLNPEGKILAGGGYLSPDTLNLLLDNVQRFWRDYRARILTQANKIEDAWVSSIDTTELADPQQGVLIKATLAIRENFDTTYGGFGVQPKLAIPVVNGFMFGATNVDGTALFRDAIERILDAQLALVDTIWGGCYHYARFADWTYPSQEKLLGANVEILSNYLDAFLLTGKERYRQAALDVLRYIDRFLRSDRGWGFFNSQHSLVLNSDSTASSIDYFSLDDSRRRALGMPPLDSSLYIESNALAISAYLKAAQVLDSSELREYALTTLDHIRDRAVAISGGYYHDAAGNSRELYGHLADEVAVASAFLDAYEHTGEGDYLAEAKRVTNFILNKLKDEETGALFDYPSAGNAVGRLATGLRPYPANCAAAVVLMRLYYMTFEEKYKEAAAGIVYYLSKVPVEATDLRRCHLASASLWLSQKPVTFLLVGEKNETYQQLVKAAFSQWYPRVVVMHPEESHVGELEFFTTRVPTLFVFSGGRRPIPITDPSSSREKIKAYLHTAFQQ